MAWLRCRWRHFRSWILLEGKNCRWLWNDVCPFSENEFPMFHFDKFLPVIDMSPDKTKKNTFLLGIVKVTRPQPTLLHAIWATFSRRENVDLLHCLKLSEWKWWTSFANVWKLNSIFDSLGAESHSASKDPYFCITKIEVTRSEDCHGSPEILWCRWWLSCNLPCC